MIWLRPECGPWVLAATVVVVHAYRRRGRLGIAAVAAVSADSPARSAA